MPSVLRVDTIQTTAGVQYVNNGLISAAQSADNITGGVAGQILYQSAAGTTAKLSAGANTQVLIGGASVPAWSNISGLSVGSAATLTTARTINGVSFNGSANIVVNPSSGAYSNGFGSRTVSTSAPSGGSDGDIWYKY
jgi:hypothetical protein